MTTERTGQAPTGHAPTGPRERKKRLTYQAVSDAASCTGSPTTRTRPPAW